MSDHADIYQRITDQILAMLEAGQGKFELPWRRSGRLFRPTNALTGKPYQGINILALWAAADKAGYTSGQWATYRQWTELGAQVRKGEKASFVLFYKQPASPGSEESEGQPDAAEETARRSRRWLAKASCVFAAEQVTGFEPAEVPATDPFESSVRAELLIASTGAVIHHGWDQACYIPARDEIRMPAQEAFVGTTTSSPSESYYSTLFHELTHWTGASHRCDRDLGQRFGKEAYAIEELVAELGAAFLCADVGIASEPRPDHAHYVSHWLNVLRQDRKALMTAASKASQAVAFMKDLDALTLSETQPDTEPDRNTGECDAPIGTWLPNTFGENATPQTFGPGREVLDAFLQARAS